APEPRRLRVPVDGAAADDGRQVVDVTDERAVDALRRLVLGAAGARLEQLVLALEGAPRLHLVVAEQRADPVLRAEAGQQVAPLLEDEHRVARPAQRPGRRAAAGP